MHYVQSDLLVAIESAIKEYEKIIKNKKKNEIPQADDLDKIMAVPFAVSRGINTDYKMASYFQFSKRQSSYYRNATEILGLVSTKNGTYLLTESGKKFIQLSIKSQKKYFVKLLLEFSVIRKIFFNLNANQKRPFSKNDVIKILKVNSNLTGSTLTRRAHTILKWLQWIKENIELMDN